MVFFFLRQGNSPEAQEIARQLEGKLGDLETALQRAVAGRVGDDFMDVQGPLKQLERAAKAPLGMKLTHLYAQWTFPLLHEI